MIEKIFVRERQLMTNPQENPLQTRNYEKLLETADIIFQ